MIRALLVDDEPPARARLKQLLVEAGDVLVIGEAGDADEARARLEATRPDVIFLDIEMPVTKGTEFAASLPEPRPFIVFATAYDQYALEAFRHDATDYLVKPVTRARLGATLDRVRARLAERSDLQRELDRATAVQAAMLKRVLPAMPGFAGAALTVPARGVGGDFYDAFPLGAGRFGLALGDVAGKGMPAGLLASSVQAALRTAAPHAAAADALVAAVNRDVCAVSDGARFATLMYLALDTTTRGLTVVNAGHPPLLVVPAGGGAPRLVPATGPVLGLLPDAAYTAHALTLAAGDVVVTVSDGALEAVDEHDEEFGEARLITAVRGGLGHPPDAIGARIVDAVRAHRGTVAAHDDLTVLVLT